ncbi:MAG: hypothetical protein AAF787_14525 [Chloroflexota bacterium]
MNSRQIISILCGIVALTALSFSFYQSGQAHQPSDETTFPLTETGEAVRGTAYLEATAVVQLTQYPATVTAWADNNSDPTRTQSEILTSPTTNTSASATSTPDIYATATRLIAQLTTSPTATLTVYSTPTPTPVYCGYAFANWGMGELSEDMTTAFLDVGFEGHVSAFTFQAQNVTETCDENTVAASIYSRFTVVTQADFSPTQDEYTAMFERVVEFTLQYSYTEWISVSNLNIQYYYESPRQTRYICTDFRAVEVAYFLGARGDDLLNAAWENSCE